MQPYIRILCEALQVRPQEVWVDGLYCPDTGLPSRAIVQGDSSVASISAASILAKTARDAAMLQMHECYPQYGFAAHKGYPTAAHLAALRLHGVSVEHRRSFRPVRELLFPLPPAGAPKAGNPLSGKPDAELTQR